MVGSIRTGIDAVAAGGDHALAQDARRRRDRDDHLVGLDRVEHARQLVGRAEHLVPGHAHALLARVVVHEPDRRRAQAGVAAQLGSATCWPPLPAPTISTSCPARSSIAPRAGRSNAQRTAKRAPQTNTSASRKSIAMTRARRVVAADREQEQHDDQPGGGDDRRLEDRLEVLLVDEAPQLRVEAERRVDRDLHRHRDPDRVGEQLLVAVRDPLVEAQHVRQPVGERRAGPRPRRPGRRDGHSLRKAGISWFAGGEQHCDEFARVAPDAQASVRGPRVRPGSGPGSSSLRSRPSRSRASSTAPSLPSKVVNTGVPNATASRFMVPPAEITRSA